MSDPLDSGWSRDLSPKERTHKSIHLWEVILYLTIVSMMFAMSSTILGSN